MSIASSDGAGALLERDEILASLDELWSSVRSSTGGRLLLVGGEAGVGKTALLRRFCEAEGKPARILWGGCEPLRTPPPLGPFLDVAEGLGGEIEELVAAAARPHEVAAALLRELRAGPSTVLVLEDVHWADEATLDVLVLLAARISSAPALVLASYRLDELDRSQQLRLILGELVRRSGRLVVEPLSKAAVAQLADRRGMDGEELYRRTGGNSFFVTEALAAGGEQIPETVRDAVLARTARLSGRARRLLEAVAVVPRQVDLWLLEALASELIDSLEECVASGVLAQGHASVAFRHELARLAVEAATPQNRRVALHRAAHAALETRGGVDPDCARLAHHAEAAGDRDGVVRWAPAAAERAARAGSHREAAAHYGRALGMADGLPLERRTKLLRGRVDECWLTDQFAAAIKAQEEALDCQRRLGDRLGEGDALRTLSRLLFFVGRVREGEVLALEAIELLERLPAGHELAMAYANVSQRRMVVEDVAGAIEWGNRALELGRFNHDTEAVVYALINIGAAEFQAGAEEGAAKQEQALTLARNNGLEDYVGRAFPSLVRCALRQRRFDLVDAYLTPGLDYCRERGLDTWRLYLLTCRAQLALDRGHWDESASSAGEVLRDPRSAPFPRGLALTILGRLRARRGDPDPSGPLAEEQALAKSTGELGRIGPNASARAEAAWLAGEDGNVERETDSALALALQRESRWVVDELACWRWRAGVHEKLPRGSAATPYAQTIAGEWRRAAELWRSLGCPYESALALADGDEDALRRSHAELRALGAGPAAAIVARRMRKRGVRGAARGPRARTRDNPAGLTARELEVLALVADGLRNAQIAARLIVSEKTVDHHVSAILRKLDVRTRGEAGVEARRRGLTDPG